MMEELKGIVWLSPDDSDKNYVRAVHLIYKTSILSPSGSVLFMFCLFLLHPGAGGNIRPREV